MAMEAYTDVNMLRRFAIGGGIVTAILFLVVGVLAELQTYADGSIFAYSIAVLDAWAFHWHNISGRLSVYLLFFVPAEAINALTGDARAGIVAYGVLQFGLPGLALLATFAADHSRDRTWFMAAATSTAILCPLVVGFPTEMWAAHALFWPTIAICHRDRRGVQGFALALGAMISLILTHEGAVIFALSIVTTLALRGWRTFHLWRGLAVLAIALAVWAGVKLTLRPDDYFAGIIARAALNFIDPEGVASPVFGLLGAAVAAYGVAVAVLRRVHIVRAEFVSAIIVGIGLCIYWVGFDVALHASGRYAARTALLIGTPLIAGLAALITLQKANALRLPAFVQPRIVARLMQALAPRLAIGFLSLVLLIHAVETAKFVKAWVDYRAAIRALAMGDAVDPELGDARFVSSGRVGDDLNRLAWMSTTPYLSVLVAPGFAPRRLVVDPARYNYFWLSCQTATKSAATAQVIKAQAIPAGSLALIRDYSCLHRN